MKTHWFLSGLTGLISVFCLAVPAEAGNLSSWQYDQTQNVLQFDTDEAVQPRAQLVNDPTRLVIDLPGTTLNRSPINQLVGGAIQRIRIGQFDAQTTRIVIELAPGYTLDSQQIRFRGLSPTQWTVQLPEPQFSNTSASTVPEDTFSGGANGLSSNASNRDTSDRSTFNTFNHSTSDSNTSNSSTSDSSTLGRSTSNSSASNSRTSSNSTSSNNISSNTAASRLSSSRRSPANSGNRASSAASSSEPLANGSTSATPTQTIAQVEGVQVTGDGLFINTQGGTPEVKVERSRNRRSITVEIDNAMISSRLVERQREVDRHGIEDLEVSQVSERPPVVQIELDMSRRSADWVATTSSLGGIILLPEDSDAARATTDPEPTAETTLPRTAASSRNNLSSRNTASQSTSSQNSTRSASSRSASRSSHQEPTESPSSPAPAATEVPRMQLATIQGVNLDISSNQLLIQSDRPIAHTGRWQSGMYQVILSPARLADRVAGPQLDTNSPLRRVRLRQEDDETVVISIQPASGIQFGTLNLVTPQLLALGFSRSQPSLPPQGTASSRPNTPIPNRSMSNTLPNTVPNGRPIVVIDPGHGGADVGAVGIGGIQEADIVLAISQQVASLLSQRGIQVIMTRTDDSEVELEPRVQMAEQARATVFVSIHANSISMDRPDVNGVETYYYSSGEQLAEVIHNSIISGLGTGDRGVRQARFYVLRTTSMPAVLVETGFVTGSEDAARLADAGFRNQMAMAIARGILQYVQQFSASPRN